MDKNKMLIDATHPEETRVVALRNGRVEEFDFESAARKLLRGNIYLAKVTRVEPSLQAAFIDYGGNRHGFLAFNEIHPDYYQIPVADREALKEEEARSERQAEEEADERARPRGASRRRRRGRNERTPDNAEARSETNLIEAPADDQPSDIETFEDGYRTSGPNDADAAPREGYRAPAPLEHVSNPESVLTAEPQSFDDEGRKPAPYLEAGDDLARPGMVSGYDHDQDHAASDHSDDEDDAPESGSNGRDNGDDEHVEQIATDEDALEELPERPRRRARQYKIQEVIKRRQIMLVQVVKEERGNKGAALTTYISLAGRYTVLMPNTARGGGISRKITQPQDRKRLKAIAEELDVEEGMGLIIRTAGAARTKQEIKRDYDYLMRLWESVRELTLTSTAPCLVYEEGNIIKRAIRDLYSKDFDQIVVAGEPAHREAQDFMEMLMPGAGSQVASYRAPEPLFARYGIERQLNALFSPYVTLRSGGYIVINQTEALVSVDVNSGKSTREFSIEETALNTNLEAAEEIARQLKLRDLAGLIVIDFIDMEEKRNNRKVEHRIKDALRFDRARIQVGRISHFGLLEMSRQRLRAGVLEGSTSQCPHCQGTGIIRSIESVALAVLRGVEDQLLKQPSSLAAITTAEVALYILNHKRGFILEMERRYGIAIRVEASDRMQGANFTVERIAAPVQPIKPAQRAAVSMDSGFERDEQAYDEPADEIASEAIEDVESAGSAAEPRREGSEEERRGRRRRRRRGRRDGHGESRPGSEHAGPNGADGGHIHHAARPEDNDEDADDEPYHGPAGDRGSAEIEADDLPVSAAEGDEAGSGHPDGPRAEGEGNGDSRRRGRRRGRRGGRSRRREGGEAPAGVDRHEWGIAETAAEGSGQPAFGGERNGTAMGLVGSVEGGYERSLPHAHRPDIVETFSASDAALRAAVLLAGGTPPPQVAARTPVVETKSSIQPPVPARPRTVSTAPADVAPEAAAPSSASVVAPVAPVAMAATSSPVSATPAAIQPPVPAWPRQAAADTPPASPAPAMRDATPTSAAAFRLTGDVGQIASGSNGTNGASPGHDTDATAEAGSTAQPHIAERSDPSRPSRKGWWQRRFGSAD